MAAARIRRRRVVRDERLAVDYSRFSTELQGSITEQRAVNAEVAADEGVAVVKSFGDEAVSRSISERPGLLEMFAYLEAHPEVGFIVVNELERLTCGIEQRADVIRICQRLNIAIVTEDMGEIDPFDEEKMHEADQRAVAARGEVLRGQRRTRRNLKQKVLAGKVAMRPAYGVRMRPLIGPDGKELPSGVRMIGPDGRTVRSGELEPHPGEIEWLRLIFAMADRGETDEAIARYLTAQGVPTKSGRQMWRQNTIGGILTNPLYKGEYTWGKRAVKRYSDGTTYLEEREVGDPGRVTMQLAMGPLVCVEQWERINARRAVRAGELRAGRRTHEPQPFDGKVFCRVCGHKMYGQLNNAGRRAQGVKRRKPPQWRYYCHAGRRSIDIKPGFGPPCNPSHSVPVARILEALATFGDPGATATVRPLRSGADVEVEAVRRGIEREMKAAQDRFDRAKALHLDGSDIVSAEELRGHKQVLDATRAAVAAKLAALAGADVAVVPQRGEYGAAEAGLRRLAQLLADDTIPLADRCAAVDAAGIAKLYVHLPVVEVEFVRSDTGP